MPTEFTPGLIVGALVFFTGAAFLWVMMLKAGGLAFGFAALTNLSNYLSAPDNKRGRLLFALAAGITTIGACTCFVSVSAGDARRNRGCEHACELAGWDDGRYRGNPHETLDGPAVYECWCQRGSTWSPEPVTVPEPAGEE